MKMAIYIACMVITLGGLALAGCGRKRGTTFVKDPEIRAQLKTFAMAKESEAQALAAAKGEELPPKVTEFFSAVENADWETATNDYAGIKERWGRSENFSGSWWRTVVETFGAAKQWTLVDPKYAMAYGNDIIQSIPAGSIYFGGTDPGCFIVTAMEKSQVNGEPFFTLAQGALWDGSYLDYLRLMYGKKIYTPTAEDSQKCFDDYFRDFQERQAEGKLLPGESVKVGANGKPETDSWMSVIQIYGRLAELIFEKNTNKDFYVEEGYPLDWMYPYLEPHGLIFKLNHQPLASLPDDVVQQDRDYWARTISPIIGGWLKEDTSVQDVGTYAEKVFLKHDFSGFSGDTNYVGNTYTQRMFSKDRLSIAMLYQWRAKHTQNAAEKARMEHEADFAYRQAWALCPDSPETVFSYVTFLNLDENRIADALSVAETAAKSRSGEGTTTLDELVLQLKQRVKGQ
jgi:hypothetical protein